MLGVIDAAVVGAGCKTRLGSKGVLLVKNIAPLFPQWRQKPCFKMCCVSQHPAFQVLVAKHVLKAKLKN